MYQWRRDQAGHGKVHGGVGDGDDVGYQACQTCRYASRSIEQVIEEDILNLSIITMVSNGGIYSSNLSTREGGELYSYLRPKMGKNIRT